MKGIIAKAVFNLKNPNIKQEFDNFITEVDKVIKKLDISHVICLKRKISETEQELVIIPASDVKRQIGELKKKGFTIIEQTDVSQLKSKFKDFDFSKSFKLNGGVEEKKEKFDKKSFKEKLKMKKAEKTATKIKNPFKEIKEN